MAWISLKIEAQDHTADLISETLMAQGALSAIIEDANADTVDEPVSYTHLDVYKRHALT